MSLKDFVLCAFLVFRTGSQMLWDKFTSAQLGFENERLYYIGVTAIDVCFLSFLLIESKGKAAQYVYSFFLGMASFALIKSSLLDLWNTPSHEYVGVAFGVLFTAYQIHKHGRQRSKT